nr:thymidine phosphorylase [Salinicola tamaricis]
MSASHHRPDPCARPADKRLYGVRDVTATVESLPLIVASILGKKLACGLGSLVMDVKVGSGAFMPTPEAARALAEAIVATGCAAGTPTSVLLTDMNQPLARCAGNALEVAAALEVLRGEDRHSRLYRVTQALASEMLIQSGLARDAQDAERRLAQTLDNGAALERFGRMVHGLGGPADFTQRAMHYLPTAPVVHEVAAPCDGVVHAIDTRALGLAVVELGGGRRNAGDAIDPRVGLSHIAELGQTLSAGEPLLRVHAADREAAEALSARLSDAFHLQAGAAEIPPLVHATLRQEDLP